MTQLNHQLKFLILVVFCFSIGFNKLSADELTTEGEQLDNLYLGEDGEMILAVSLRDIKLSDGLFAFAQNGKVFLPLGELAALLKFPIFVDPSRGEANGWFIDPSREFQLDTSEQALVLSGDKISVRADSVISQDFDIYVAKEELETWFPLSIDLNYQLQAITIRSEEMLPIESMMERRRKQNLKNTKSQRYGARLDGRIPPFKLLDWPAVSIRLGISQTADSKLKNTIGVSAHGDFLGLNGILAASGSLGDPLESAYLRLGRRDPTGKMFGPLKVTNFELGDTGMSIPSLLGGGATGRGIRFGNRPLAQRFDHNRMNLNGPLKSGYEVELYVNGRLRSVIRETGNGVYEFKDIELSNGKNELKLEFYGPNGEHESDIKYVHIAKNNNRVGEVLYDFTAVENGKNTLADVLENTDSGNSDNSVTTALNASIGLGKFSSLDASIVTRDGDGSHIDLSANTSLAGVYISAETALDKERDSAYSLSLRTTKSGFDMGLGVGYKQADYNAIAAEVDDSSEDSWSASASLDKSYNYSEQSSPFAWGITMRNGGRVGKLDYYSLNGKADYRGARFQTVANLNYSENMRSNTKTGDGRFFFRSARSPSNNISGSAELNYRYLPEIEPIELKTSVSKSFVGDMSLGARFGYNFDNKVWNTSIGGRRVFDHFTGDSNVFYQSDDQYGFRMGVSFAAGRYPGSNQYYMRPHAVASTPRLGVLVFFDRNGNGQRDKGEGGLSEVGIALNGLAAGVKTDFFGYALLENLALDAKYDVAILDQTITNPALRAVNPSHGVVVRPGRLPLIEIPVIPTGEVEGYVTFKSDLIEMPAPNARLMLRKIGETEPLKITELYSEFDGLFSLSGIPLGEYELAIDSDLLDKAKLVSIPNVRKLSVSEGDSLWTGLDFQLIRKSDTDAIEN